MTAAQVAVVYGVAVDVIERILRQNLTRPFIVGHGRLASGRKPWGGDQLEHIGAFHHEALSDVRAG
jgi:hypothetical protein